ncbi:hypothetical protein Tco_0782433 [Tanacetum coccineum]
MEILLEPTSNKLLVDSNYLIHSYRVVCFETLRLYGGGGIPFQLKSDSLPHAHAQTTKTYYKHQDSRIKKAQELKTKTSANSDIKDNSSETKLRGRLLESFQEDAKRSQKTMTKAQDQRSHSMKEQAYNIIKTKDSRTQRQSNLNKSKEARFKISPQEFEDHTLGEIVSLKLCL